jgi:large subunit ribosomal protein L3
MKSLIGRKIGMTTVLNQDEVVPVTVIEAGPCFVIERKTRKKDGYEAIKIGFSEAKENELPKSVQGICRKVGVSPMRLIREFRMEGRESQAEVGSRLDVTVFQLGDQLRIRAVSKGKGFQGVIKRHGMAGGMASHGSMSHRRVGAIGCRTTPGKILKGKRMPGHMGLELVSARGLKVIKIEPERNLILVKGSVPGAQGGLLLIEEDR